MDDGIACKQQVIEVVGALGDEPQAGSWKLLQILYFLCLPLSLSPPW